MHPPKQNIILSSKLVVQKQFLSKGFSWRQLKTNLSSFRLAGELVGLVGLVGLVVLLVFVVLVVNSPK